MVEKETYHTCSGVLDPIALRSKAEGKEQALTRSESRADRYSYEGVGLTPSEYSLAVECFTTRT